MKASRHNGRSGKHGVYDVKHNDRDFDVENSEHIDPERTKENVYWDCYQGYSFAGSSQERQFTFTEVERAYYFEHYSDHVDAQNERNEMARHPERNRTIDDVLKNNKTCPEETVLQLGNIDETVSADVLAKVVAEYFEEFNKRYGSHVHILDWALHMDESTPHIHERHVFDAKISMESCAHSKRKHWKNWDLNFLTLQRKRGNTITGKSALMRNAEKCFWILPTETESR